jgi:hypothetical protein
VDIDTTLARTPDGGLAPKAAAGGIRFSGGGSDTRLAHLEKGGRATEFGWPTTLPTPSVSGATATYRTCSPARTCRGLPAGRDPAGPAM